MESKGAQPDKLQTAPASHEAMALQMLLNATMALDGKLDAEICDRLEAEGQAKAIRLSKSTRRALKDCDREKPTREQLAKGEFAMVDGRTFDTARNGERVLVELQARAAGLARCFRASRSVSGN